MRSPEYNVVPPILGVIDHLTNWYVRRSRRRFWRARGESGEGDTDKLAAFATLYEVLTTFIEVLAPVLPFISEHLYQDLVEEVFGLPCRVIPDPETDTPLVIPAARRSATV